jgi:copper oxidase (laccase) domain-containing protein
VLENTVAAMHTPAAKLVAWLGPAAGPQAYEIGEEVFDAFVSQDARAASAFAATRPGHWRVDLYELARQRLAALGISRVHGGGLCTISDPQRFYSHRRSTSEAGERTGRMATVVWMAP